MKTKTFVLAFIIGLFAVAVWADAGFIGEPSTSGVPVSGGGGGATVLYVPFEGNSAKNLVDNSNPTAQGGSITSDDKYVGTYSYDTEGSTTGLVYSISNFDPTDYEIRFAWKMPTYANGDYVFYIYVDANNYIYIGTIVNGTNLQLVHRAGGITETLDTTTTINDGAWHTIDMIVESGTVSVYIDGSGTPDESEAIVGTWAGSVASCMWGVEYDNTSVCDCFLDDLYISAAP